MSHNIKNLKPKKTSRYNQGYINLNDCKKLFESQQNKPVIYRSSWELYFIKWCESSDHVKYWGSECVPIKYKLCTDGKQHTYYPDYILEMKSGECWLVEIKPYNQTIKPKGTDFSTYAWQTYIKNYCKWKAANEFCNKNGLKFKILTEKTIDKLK